MLRVTRLRHRRLSVQAVAFMKALQPVVDKYRRQFGEKLFEQPGA